MEGFVGGVGQLKHCDFLLLKKAGKVDIWWQLVVSTARNYIS